MVSFNARAPWLPPTTRTVRLLPLNPNSVRASPAPKSAASAPYATMRAGTTAPSAGDEIEMDAAEGFELRSHGLRPPTQLRVPDRLPLGQARAQASGGRRYRRRR